MLVSKEFAFSMLRGWFEKSSALSVSAESPVGKFTVMGKISSIEGTVVNVVMTEHVNLARAKFDVSDFTEFEFKDMGEFDVPRVGSEQSVLALRNILGLVVVIEVNYSDVRRLRFGFGPGLLGFSADCLLYSASRCCSTPRGTDVMRFSKVLNASYAGDVAGSFIPYYHTPSSGVGWSF